MTYKIIKLNSARNCFHYIIKAFGINEIYLPFYICPVLRNTARKSGCKMNFYHIDENFYPIYDFPKDAYVLYLNYFGVCSSIVKELANKHDNLIIDNAHSFFSEPSGLASFNSIRKFFPNIRNGAFLYTQKNIDFSFPNDEFEYEVKPLSEVAIIKNEYFIDTQEIKIMSNCTFSYFSSLDLTFEKNRKRKFFEDLSSKYSKYNELKITISEYDVPYRYPLLIKDKTLFNDVLFSLFKNGNSPLRLWQKLPASYPESIFYNHLIVI